MEICVSNEIEVIHPTADLVKWCKENLVLDNPEYQKKLRMGKWLGNTPKKLVLYKVVGDTYYLPFGCIEKLFDRYKHDVPFNSRIRPIERISYDSSINLFPYQQTAVNEALRHKNGVVVMPCGAGKTQTALELIARLGGRALWLTHTQELLNQSLARAKSVLNIPTSTYGTITGGKVKIGKGLTFATVQTLSKLDISQYADVWDVVVVDECHHAIGSPTKVMQFYKVLSALNCRYKFGLTATPRRADGLERSMYAILGEKVVEISKEAVKETTCPVRVETVQTAYTPNTDIVLNGDGTLNYSELVNDLTHDEERFIFVSERINTLKSVIVLASRVEYLERLQSVYNGRSVCLSTLGNSKKAKEERRQAIEKLNSGELDAVFATYQLAKEGLDAPTLRYVVFATPEKDPTTVEQSAGRVGRKADGKEYGTVVDFVDDFGMFRGWRKKRETIYKKCDFMY